MGLGFNRIISIIWQSKSGQATADIRNLNSTLFRTDQQIRRASASTGMLARQMHTFGTTMRYAFSGAVLFGMVKAFSNMVEFRKELAQLNGVLMTNTATLNMFGKAAINISNQTATPLNDVVQSMQNIAQSIPDLSAAAQKHLIPTMAKIEALGAKVSGTDPRSFGATVLSTATAFYGRGALSGEQGPKILENVASQLVTTQFRSNRTTGADVAQYIPMLTGGAQAGKFDLAQTLALYTVAQQSIGRPATTTQYLRQLMIRMQSPTKAEKPFFEKAGLTSKVLANQGGMESLKQLISYGLTLPGAQVPDGMTPEQFLKSGSKKRVKLSGDAAQFFQTSIGGRIQSLVAVESLVRSMGQLTTEMKAQKDAVKNNTLNKRAQAILDQSPLTTFGNTMHNFMIDFAQSFTPVLNPAARLANRALQLPGAKELALGGIGIGAAALLRNKIKAGGFLGGGMNAALGAKSLLETNAPTGKPDDPFFVIVMGGSGNTNTPFDPGTKIPKGVKAAEGEAAAVEKSLFRRILGRATGIGGTALGTLTGIKGLSIMKKLGAAWGDTKFGYRLYPGAKSIPGHLLGIARSSVGYAFERSGIDRAGQLAVKGAGTIAGKAAIALTVETMVSGFIKGVTGGKLDINGLIKNRVKNNMKRDWNFLKGLGLRIADGAKTVGGGVETLSKNAYNSYAPAVGNIVGNYAHAIKPGLGILGGALGMFSGNKMEELGYAFHDYFTNASGIGPGGGKSLKGKNAGHRALNIPDVKGLLQFRVPNTSVYQQIQLIEHTFDLTDEAKKYIKEKEKKVHPPRRGVTIRGDTLTAGKSGGPIPTTGGKPKAN